MKKTLLLLTLSFYTLFGLCVSSNTNDLQIIQISEGLPFEH